MRNRGVAKGQGLSGKPSLELRYRAQQLLDQRLDWTAKRLRDRRAIEVLEYIGTSQAWEVLRQIQRFVGRAINYGAR